MTKPNTDRIEKRIELNAPIAAAHPLRPERQSLFELVGSPQSRTLLYSLLATVVRMPNSTPTQEGHEH
jgi:hypothetical protein